MIVNRTLPCAIKQLGAALQTAHVSRTRAGARHLLRVPAVDRIAGDRPRRVLHIEYAPCLDLAAGVRLAIA